MALNIHTDPQFEKHLEWLSRRLKKTKTDVVKDLVLEKYRLQKAGLRFGSLKAGNPLPSKKAQKELKSLDDDRDLD